ncbi:MAG TPA: hypothetical protein VNB52_10035, partial [Ilumatobacteraceae bacterium]|nr:hypothetical protein [Ilumatobacteraceae bacterium]
ASGETDLAAMTGESLRSSGQQYLRTLGPVGQSNEYRRLSKGVDGGGAIDVAMARNGSDHIGD